MVNKEFKFRTKVEPLGKKIKFYRFKGTIILSLTLFFLSLTILQLYKKIFDLTLNIQTKTSSQISISLELFLLVVGMN